MRQRTDSAATMTKEALGGSERQTQRLTHAGNEHNDALNALLMHGAVHSHASLGLSPVFSAWRSSLFFHHVLETPLQTKRLICCQLLLFI